MTSRCDSLSWQRDSESRFGQTALEVSWNGIWAGGLLGPATFLKHLVSTRKCVNRCAVRSTGTAFSTPDPPADEKVFSYLEDHGLLVYSSEDMNHSRQRNFLSDNLTDNLDPGSIWFLKVLEVHLKYQYYGQKRNDHPSFLESES